MNKKTIKFMFSTAVISITFSTCGMIFVEGAANELSSGIKTITGNEAEENSFFGVASRTKYLNRWSTLISCEQESLNDHLLDTARIAHMLCIIKNKKFGGDLDAERAVVLAVYHDLPEIITDDMPTPIKHSNSQMESAYNEIEEEAISELLAKMPEEFREDFKSILHRQESESELWKIVKYADTISALIKCLREKSLGNKDFDSAFLSLEQSLLESKAPEVEYFMKTFLPSYSYTYPETSITIQNDPN